MVEGAPATFTLTAAPVPLSATTVSLDWQYFASRTVGTPPATVTFDAGSGAASVTVRTVDNQVRDGDIYFRVIISSRTASPRNAYAPGLDPVELIDVTDND